MGARKPPQSPEQRLLRALRSMAPGSMNGRVASAAPMTVDQAQFAARARALGSPGPTLNTLPDVDPTGLANGDVPVWDDTSKTWKPGSAGRQLSSIQVQASGANGGIGTTNFPGLNVGENWELTLPMIGVHIGSPEDLTVSIAQNDDGSGTYNVFAVQIQVFDPITGDYGIATGSLSPVPHSGVWPPTLSNTGSSGTTFTWSGTAWQRATDGPVMGWADIAVLRTA